MIVLANLRGVRESGLLFALPTYAFVDVDPRAGRRSGSSTTSRAACTTRPFRTRSPSERAPSPSSSSCARSRPGSTALTGVEAIANGVNAFRHPQGKNAAKTLAVLGTIAIAMFLGVSYLAVQVHALPSTTDSVVSQIARAVFPPGSFGGFMYYAVQGTTLLVLVLAANTSFQGFPRLSALLARDRFAPRQFSNLGDRLVFSNGMLVLAAAAAGLLVIYKANTNSLIHLYVIGVFTAFTISQARDGALLAAHADPGLARAGARQRRRCVGDGPRHGDRGLDEVRGGRLARHRRDPGARVRDARRAATLRPGRATAERRRRRGRIGTGGAQSHAARRRGARPRGRAGARRRAQRSRRRGCARFTYRATAATPGSVRAGSISRAASRAWRRSTRRAERSTRCSSRSGGCRAASPTSSRSSSRSSSAGARSPRRPGTRSSSRSSCGC